MCQDCERFQKEISTLKRRIARLRSELKKERLEKERIRQEKPKNHYQNGRKRSRFGRI